MEEIGASE